MKALMKSNLTESQTGAPAVKRNFKQIFACRVSTKIYVTHDML